MKTKKIRYKLRHIRCNMTDFHAGRHRFRFEYNGKEHIASCYHAFDIIFDDDENLPEHVIAEVEKLIWDKIDSDESKWRYPAEAYTIANEYCKENFS